jgi:hypothetical protein
MSALWKSIAPGQAQREVRLPGRRRYLRRIGQAGSHGRIVAADFNGVEYVEWRSRLTRLFGFTSHFMLDIAARDDIQPDG